MKKRIGIILLAVALLITGCGGGKDQVEDEKKIRIGVSPVPHEEIAKIAKEKLEEKGIELEIIVFDDYVQPNLALNEGDLDANFFQHKPYLEKFNSENKTDLISLGGVHIEPIAFYSKAVESLDQLEDGAEILIPNDATNGSRALLLLEENGLIKLRETDLATVNDIEENPKNLKFTELEAALIPGSYEEVDGAVINSNYAIGAGLNPLEDGIAIEGKESDYANVIAVKEERKDEDLLKSLYEAFTSDEVRKFIDEKYQGAILPAF